MTSAAVIVGVDDYLENPLTSAVNDAVAFRDALNSLHLVEPGDVRMFTAPVGPGTELATKKNITDCLWDFYSGAVQTDRLYVYFAGHGMSVFTDAARSTTQTVVVPWDVRNLDKDGENLISIDEVVARFRLAGPAEQLYFIDACRDLPWERHPATGSLGWAAADASAARAQAVLYAVSPLGRAVSEKQGMGVFTTHLIDALNGRGCSADYSEERDRYLVTVQSIRTYVCEKLKALVSTRPLWEQRYMLPELLATDPPVSPLREIPQVDQVALTVHVQPDDAAAKTSVLLCKSRYPLKELSWPPNANHASVLVDPQWYRLETTSEAGLADPPTRTVHPRKESEVTINIQVGGKGQPPATSDSGIVPPTLETLVAAPPQAFRGVVPGLTGTIHAHCEPAVTIEIEGLQPPYEKRSAMQSLTDDLPPGAYRMRFRLGTDVFNESDVLVVAGETVEITSAAPASPLVREMRRHLDSTPDGAHVHVSKGVDGFQAGVIETVLPMIGLKPFDKNNEILPQLVDAVPIADPAEFDDRPLSIVLAIDGDQWDGPAEAVVRATRIRMGSARGEIIDSAGGPQLTPVTGMGRIGLALASAPKGSFSVLLEEPHFGSIRLIAGALDHRVTAITVRIHSAGSLDVSQNLLRIPGRDYQEPSPSVPYDRAIRQLQLGQKLYRAGELAHGGPLTNTEDFRELFYAKWTDPIVSCMAFFATVDAMERGVQIAASEPWFLDEVAHNLLKYFGDLPDSRIVAALQMPGGPPELVLDEMLDSDEVPVLARAAEVLAAHAQKEGRTDAAVLAWTPSRIPDLPWTLAWNVAPSAASAREPVATSG